MYPHRLTNSQPRVKDTANISPGDNSLSVGNFRRSDGVHSSHNSVGQRQAELTGPDNSLVSAGAILVAIVALSCAIILVLLGITVYLCGHKGFGARLRRDHGGNRRAGNAHANSLNANTVSATNNNEFGESVIDPIKCGTLTVRAFESDQVNSAQTNYSDPILIDPGSGTLLRCQLGTKQAVTELNPNEYADQKLLCMSSPVSYDGYTTCLPMAERIPISGTYEAIPAGRILFPITSGTFAGTNGTSIVVNNGEFLGTKFAAGTLIKPKSRQTARGLIQAARGDKKPSRTYCADRQFTQSLKLKRSDWVSACDSPVSEGSGPAAGEHRSGRLRQPRAAKSWETLVAVPSSRVGEVSRSIHSQTINFI